MRYPPHWPDEHPDDPRIYVPNIEVYVTNVCNLSCSQCNRFNDHDFAGWQHWSDYEAQYTEWSKKIRLQRITILGGEPLLNPSICDWVTGFNRLWHKRVEILTNGTRLNQVPGLYDTLARYKPSPGNSGKNWIGISVHNTNDLDRYFDEVKKFLPGDIKFFDGKKNPRETWSADYAFRDSNNIQVNLYIANSFNKSAIQKNNLNQFTLHQSDSVAAHNICGFAKFQDYHFIRAKLYKCGPVALFPEFDLQHHLNISDEDRELLNSYRPLTIDEFDQRGQQFIDDIDDAIPQCKFCPDKIENNIAIQSLNKAKNATSSFIDK
jgi:organic radical activating enzyme